MQRRILRIEAGWSIPIVLAVLASSVFLEAAPPGKPAVDESEILSDEEALIRRAEMRILGRDHELLTTDELRENLMLREDPRAVASVAAELVADPPPLTEANRQRKILNILLEVAGKYPNAFSSATPKLIQAFPRLHPTDQHAACRILSTAPGNRQAVIAHFQSVMRDDDWEHRFIRTYAAGSLLKVDPENLQAMRFLVAQLKSRETPDQIRAAYALQWAGTGARQVLPHLRSGMRSENAGVRAVCASAAWSAGAEANEVLPVLREALRHHDDLFFVEPSQATNLAAGLTPSRWAAASLGRMGSAAKVAVPDLIEQLQTDSDVQFWAICQGLGSMGPDATAAIPTLLKLKEPGNRPSRRPEILDALRRIRRPVNVPQP